VSIDWKSIAVVGEYTTSSGPYFDDHFLVLISQDGEIMEFPTQELTDSLKIEIERALGIQMEYGLCNVAQEASRVIFPPNFLEHPLFQFSLHVPGSLGEFAKSLGRFGDQIDKRLTDEIQAYLRGLAK
jgi:hypothetical protein